MRTARVTTVVLVLAASMMAGCGGAGDSESSAENYVVDTFDNPMHYEEWAFLSPPWGDGSPPDVIRVALDGDCAALQIQVVGRSFADTVFLLWEGEWVPQDLVTGPDAFAWLDASADNCWIRP